MLRGIVLLFLLLNAALWFWIQSDPPALRADREPERLGRQVHPEAIQVLPDLPRPGGTADSPAPATIATPSPAAPAVPGDAASAAQPASASTALVHKTGVALACAESGPLDAGQWATLTQALARAGVPAAALGERREQPSSHWIVYMGRYGDEQQWQHKADELRRLNLKFERVNAPPGLAPGLSLGSFASQEEASTRLDELGRHGVHTARVVAVAAPAGPLRHLQVRADGDSWRSAVAGQRFSPCPPAPAASV